MARVVSPSSGVLTELSPERCLLETGGSRLDTVAVHIAMLGVEFEVLEPPELVDAAERVLATLQRSVARSKKRRPASRR